MLHWRKAFRSSIRIIDEDHVQLFRLLNDIEAHGNLRRDTDVVGVNRSIDALLAYCLEHFAREERLMGQLGYPEAPAHAGKHTFLRESFIEALHPLVAGEISVATFLRVVRGQFVNHFMRDDYQFVRWAGAREEGGRVVPFRDRRHLVRTSLGFSDRRQRTTAGAPPS